MRSLQKLLSGASGMDQLRLAVVKTKPLNMQCWGCGHQVPPLCWNPMPLQVDANKTRANTSDNDGEIQ